MDFIKNRKFILTILPEDLEKDVSLSENISKEKFLLIFLSKDNYGVHLNKTDYADNKNGETVIRDINGDFKIEIYSIKGALLDSFNFYLSKNKFHEIIVVPNYLNIGSIKLYKNGVLIDQITEYGLNVFCNENNICEPGEENLCPLDCPSANNPNYPLASPLKELQVEYKPYEEKVTPQKELKELKEVTPTIALPEKSFSYIASITIIIFGIIFILGVLIYLKFKK